MAEFNQDKSYEERSAREITRFLRGSPSKSTHKFLKIENTPTDVMYGGYSNYFTIIVQKQTSPSQNRQDMKEDNIILRDIPLKEALKEIANLFKKKKQLFYSDIVEELHLDFDTVIRACRKLEKGGKIEEVKRGQKKAKKKSK